MHVPINIPSMSMSVGVDVDMSTEMLAHSKSNLLAGLLCQLPNYMCYSNSIAYAKSGGKGELSSLAIVLLTAVLFLYGSPLVAFIPRAMAGTLLIHVGVDLFLEGVEDQGFDRLERFSISLIVITMTLGGMTAGLFVGMIMASVTFVVNAGTHLHPIRGSMRASTLRSSKWRTPRAWKTLLSSFKLRRTLCVQLQGHLYFANINLFADEIKALLLETPNWYNYIILDFTLVLGVDSSAAFALIKLVDQMKPRKLRWISFVTGKDDGFPCTVNLSEQLEQKAGVGINQVRGRMEEADLMSISSKHKCATTVFPLQFKANCINQSSHLLPLHSSRRT